MYIANSFNTDDEIVFMGTHDGHGKLLTHSTKHDLIQLILCKINESKEEHLLLVEQHNKIDGLIKLELHRRISLHKQLEACLTFIPEDSDENH